MSAHSVDPATLSQWLKDGSAMLVDVREPAEHRASHIPGARLMPLSRFDAAALDTVRGKLVVHCLKGGRGNSACAQLLKHNPALELYNLEGGIAAWQAAGLPVESGKAALPLDRQVQLTIGILLLLATALTQLVSPDFVWLAAAIGLGLTIAGTTGFCGMAMVMARMPWNR